MNASDLLRNAIERQRSGDLDAAEQTYRQILRHFPRLPDAHHLLGTVYLHRGRVNDAIQSISAAISIDPTQAIFYNNLGNCYLSKLDRVAAELCFRQALALQPDYADAWNNVGLALMGSGRFDDARKALERSLTMIPEHENALCNLGTALKELHQYDEALAVYERAIALHPRSASAWLGKVICLSKLSRPDEALSIVDRVAELDPNRTAEAMQQKGTLLEVVGRLDEACAAFDRGIETNPGGVELLFARAQARKISKDEPFYDYLRRFESHINDVSGMPRAQMCYALGKGHQDAGDIEAASRFYAEGAATILQNVDFDEEEEERLVNGIRRLVTPDYLDSLRGAGVDSRRPIFIVGMPRSGTTLVEQILASHPDVFPGGELTLIPEVLNHFELPGGTRFSRAARDLVASDASLRERADAYLKMIDELPGAAAKVRVTDKLPGNFLSVGLLVAMFPNATIIHCRRDPVDTCISCYTTLFGTGHYWTYDLGALGRYYRRYWNLMAYWRDALPGRFLEVRYDQVVEDTEQAARMLLEWAGLSWDEKVLRFYETNRPVTTASVRQVRQPIYKSSMGRWKKWQPYIKPLLDEISDIETAYWEEVGVKADL